MKTVLPRLTIAAMLIGLLAGAAGTSIAADRPVDILGEYFDLLISGNVESAMYLWNEPSLERASRFGIVYTDIPLKNDCNSPVIRDLKLFRNHLQPVAKRIIALDDQNYQRLLYSSIVEGELVEHNYYMYFDGNYWWLCYPQDYYCRDWPVRESRYLRLHVDPSAERYLNPVSIEAADSFIERIADSLKLSKDQMKMLRDEKIDYFYCGSDSTIEQITGHLVKGVFDLPSNDLISSFFPHYHELIHFLVTLKLQRLPLYAQPLLREGIAVTWGGRWGKTPTSLLDLGGFLYREKIVDLDSMLTMSLFELHSGADIGYPVAGLFCAFLLDRMGRERFFEVYLKLSGDFETVYAQTVPEVKQIFVEAAKTKDWAGFLERFDKFIEKVLDSRLMIRPGTLAKGKVLIEGDNYIVRANKHWLGFEFSFEPGQKTTGNLMFGFDKRLAAVSSILFGEQYGVATNVDGYRFGVRFDRNEVGLYDYATSHLMAKYIWGITPSDDYFDEANNRITLMLHKDLLKNHLPEKNDVKYLAQ